MKGPRKQVMKSVNILAAVLMAAAGKAYASGAALDSLKTAVPATIETTMAYLPQPAMAAQQQAKPFAVWTMGQQQVPSETGYNKAFYYSGTGLPAVKVVKHYSTSGFFLEYLEGKDEVSVGGKKVEITVSADFRVRIARSASVQITITGNGDILDAVMNGKPVTLTYQGKSLIVKSSSGVTTVTDRSSGPGSYGPMELSGSDDEVNLSTIAYLLAFELDLLS